MSKLPNAEMRKVEHERFSHLDFLFSNLSKSLVFPDVMNVLEIYRQNSTINELDSNNFGGTDNPKFGINYEV